MTSRKQEERNEKIIRGLMKLPPNRKCINCNSLGPQYVCTNFWTFVCMTCSGIHREFTHRVKSVSMSKFTTQEVEALQIGGNQRAREIYLKDWDPHTQRFPLSSNADKVREFIKNVYVDRRYAGGMTPDKPPRDTQSTRNLEDDTRRASSYHSYSQSPPYDYQYENRRYGKQGAVLSRKPGSDRGHYEGKISSFVYSPSRLSDQMCEDRFANEGSNSRVSDYSVSSAGDTFRSANQSPNFQDIGYRSPTQTSREANTKREVDGIPRPQRTLSTSSFGSLDTMSFKSVNSGSLKDFISESEQSAGADQDKMSNLTSLARSSNSGNFGGLDLFEARNVHQPVSSSPSSVDLFQLPPSSSAPPADFFQSPPISSASSMTTRQLPQSTTPSSDFFSETARGKLGASLNEISPVSPSKNEGWATFDVPQPRISNPGIENLAPAIIPPNDKESLGHFVLPSNTDMQWPSFQNSSGHIPSSLATNTWNEGMRNVQASINPISAQSWNAFEDSTGPLHWDSIQQCNEPQVTSHAVAGPSYTPSAHPQMGSQLHASDRKSTNPFDLPYESDLEPSNMLDMNSLQAALPPNGPLPSSFLGGVAQPWFPQNPVPPYISASPPGGLAYLAGQAPSPQLPNVQTQGPLASIGGNPFA